MNDVLYHLYVHYGMFALLVPLMVTMTISQEDVGRIKANLDTLLTSVKDLAIQIAAVMVEQANQSRTLGILCSQQTENAKTLDDHEVRLRDHTKTLVLLKEEVDEHDAAIKEIKAVVLIPKAKAAIETSEEEESPKEYPRWLIVLYTVACAAGGATLLEFIKAIITGKP